MKVLIINSVCGVGSTGKIVVNIAKDFIKNGDECVIAYGREKAPKEYENFSYRIGNDLSVRINGIKARIFDNEGFNAKRETKKFIKWADKYSPDLVWLHNLHGYYINVELLFNWIKSKPNLEVKWTLHDCWAFTGHCTHFSYIKCEKWKKQCCSCPQKYRYPKSSIIDRSEINYVNKKIIFTSLNELELIVPSNWLKEKVKSSFLKHNKITILNNSVDREVFKNKESNFRDKYNLNDKKLILGVANPWTDRKGFNSFVELSKKIRKDYRLIMVGLSAKQLKKIPSKILGIGIVNQEELVNIYNAVDLLLSLSVEETFGMTVLEAQNCGLHTMVIEGTACEEVGNKEKNIVVKNDLNDIVKKIYEYMG